MFFFNSFYKMCLTKINFLKTLFFLKQSKDALGWFEKQINKIKNVHRSKYCMNNKWLPNKIGELNLFLLKNVDRSKYCIIHLHVRSVLTKEKLH